MVETRLNAFYAYATWPSDVAACIATTINNVNRLGGSLKLIDWRSLDTSGRIIINDICEQIDKSDIFVCDLTSHNHNVLFELGYAIAKRKPVWITLNEEHKNARDGYRDLKLITTVRYLGFSSIHELENRLFRQLEIFEPESAILNEFTNIIRVKPEHFAHTIFVMKSWIETPESTELERELRSGRLSPIFDDPQEGTGQTLGWYIENTFHSTAILAHLAPSNDSSRSLDAKYSLAAGLAYGFGNPLLILAHSPQRAPIDYRDLTFVHNDPASCISAYHRWISKVRRNLTKPRSPRRSKRMATLDIRNVDLGHYLAENEDTTLRTYFVKTVAYTEALQANKYMLFIGRKGTGKTANLYILSETIQNEQNTHVCLVQPLRHHVEGILRLFGLSETQADTGYLLAAIWKFLVYSELACSVYQRIVNRPVQVAKSDLECNFVDYVDSNEDLIRTDFAQRLDNALSRICEMQVFGGTPQEKSKVSEILHTQVIGRLRMYLGELLSSTSKVAVLIDNLDQGWERREDLRELSRFLFGLISVAPEIADDFNVQHLNRPKINLSIILFLRTDIFHHVKQFAAEPDKLLCTHLTWSDKEMLWQVVERRFSKFAPNISGNVDWQEFFVSQVQGKTIRDFVLSRVIPRPRDIIYFFRSSLMNAKHRNHIRIEEKDLIDAENDYSNFAVDLLLAEVSSSNPLISKQLLYEFIGEFDIMTQDEVRERLRIGGIAQDQASVIVQVLVEYSFFALETAPGEFTFIYEDSERERVFAKARRLQETATKVRYRIHPAFHTALEITCVV